VRGASVLKHTYPSHLYHTPLHPYANATPTPPRHTSSASAYFHRSPPKQSCRRSATASTTTRREIVIRTRHAGVNFSKLRRRSTVKNNVVAGSTNQHARVHVRHLDYSVCFPSCTTKQQERRIFQNFLFCHALTLTIMNAKNVA
jgi:hypothetical protein